MPKRIFHFTLLAFFALWIVFPISIVRAEGPLRITSMNVSVWPEYDQPGVLVQYQGQIAGKSDKTNPREISFLVPKDAGVGAACAIKSDGNHTSETWKESDAGDGFVQVTFKLTEPTFHLEYYFNPLVGSPDKKIDFVYKAIMPADEIQLDIQHPLKATNFALNPDAPDSHKDSDGFTYHSYTFKQVAAGQKISSSVAYTKTDPKPSVTGQTNSVSAESASQNSPNLNQAIAVGIVIGAIGIAGFFFLQRNVRQPTRTRAVRRDARGEQTGGFCTQCGNAMEAEDKFCARCGAAR